MNLFGRDAKTFYCATQNAKTIFNFTDVFRFVVFSLLELLESAETRTNQYCQTCALVAKIFVNIRVFLEARNLNFRAFRWLPNQRKSILNQHNCDLLSRKKLVLNWFLFFNQTLKSRLDNKVSLNGPFVVDWNDLLRDENWKYFWLNKKWVARGKNKNKIYLKVKFVEWRNCTECCDSIHRHFLLTFTTFFY